MRHCSIACSVLAVVLLEIAAPVAADEPAPLPTLLAERGKPLLSNELSKLPTKPWEIRAPQWDVVEGALRATHLPPINANHGPVLHHPLSAEGVAIQLAIKAEGKASVVIHLNKKDGHLCRVILTPDAMYLVRRDSGPDKGTRIAERELPIARDEWHTLVFEVVGKTMLATLDGRETIFGDCDDLDVTKTVLILESAAGTAWFKNFRVWEATPSPAWPATKAKLLAEKK